MLDWVHAIGRHFSPEAYLFWTRIQATAWSVADLMIVFYLIRITNLCRTVTLRRSHRFSYVILAVTIPLVVLLPLARTGTDVLRLELCITIPHFLIMLYLMMADARGVSEALADHVRRRLEEKVSAP
jgi:hypothetical protein